VATVASFKREVKIDFGLLDTDEALRMTGYIEKPSYLHLVSMGCYILQRDAVAPYLKVGQHLDMPELMRMMIADGCHVHCHVPNCVWLDIGRPEDYAVAQDLFANSRQTFLRTTS
jgi:NDP-sugar pyrophosphorylase family protein